MITVSVSGVEIKATPEHKGTVRLEFSPPVPTTVTKDIVDSLLKLGEVSAAHCSVVGTEIFIERTNMLFSKDRIAARAVRIARAVVGGESVLLGPSRFAAKKGNHRGNECFIVMTDFRNSERGLLEYIQKDPRFLTAEYIAGGYNLHVHTTSPADATDDSSEDGVLEVVKKLIQDFYCITEEPFNIRKAEASSLGNIQVEFNRCYDLDRQVAISQGLGKIDGVCDVISRPSYLFFKIANDFFDENKTVGEVFAFLKGYDAGIPAP